MSIDLPSVLSFERKLETSDALMYAGSWGESTESYLYKNWVPISISLRKNRGTKSSYEHRNKPNELMESNLAEGDDANLPHDKNTLKVSFSIRIIGNVGKPFACNDPAFTDALDLKMNSYKEGGFVSLAFRYAYNIANGRFLWRNRVCAEQIIIKVRTDAQDNELTFNPRDFSLNDFSKNENDSDLQTLVDVISTGLNGDENTFSFIEVDAYIKLGNGQHVFPSQEMNMGEKKKVLFRLPVGSDGKECAAIHNVKIGNAIRTIDNWYNGAEFPIAVEPYGSVTQMGQAYRKNKTDGDFYSLLIGWLNDDELNDNDKNFVVANLIRGGVFGGKAD